MSNSIVYKSINKLQEIQSRSEKIILNLSASDYGGAGKFAVNFNNLIQEDGLQSYLVVKESKTEGKGIISYQDSSFKKPVGKLLRKYYKQKLTDDFFAYDFYFYNKYESFSVVSARQILAQIPRNPDVIFVHWVTDFINARVIHELKQLTNAKIYWLLIDNAPLTGGCHYPWKCTGYLADCANCPAVLTERYKWVATDNMAFKKKYLPADTGIIAFSASDYHRAKQSALFSDKEVIKMLGYVDETIFKPGSKATARHHFNVPADEPVLFFGASSLKEKRKGMQLLLDALEANPTHNSTLLIAGDFPSGSLKGNVKNLGYLNEGELVTAYQAADVFVCPSIEDSGPMMINQSLMCGTPVVAFDTGVAQDLVNDETGYRAKLGDAHDLAHGIAQVLNRDDSGRAALQARCRSMAQQAYGRTAFASAIRQLIPG